MRKCPECDTDAKVLDESGSLILIDCASCLTVRTVRKHLITKQTT